MRAFASRLVAGPIAALVTWLIGMGLEVGVGFQTALTEAATLLVVAVITALYGIVHRLIDRTANPADAADPAEATASARAKADPYSRRPL